MITSVNQFYASIENAANLSKTDRVAFFVYYLTIVSGCDAAAPRKVENCFFECKLSPPKNIFDILLKGYKTKSPRYVRARGGFALERHAQENLEKRLSGKNPTAPTKNMLRDLESRITDKNAREFLRETIDCFDAGAYRATIIMVWILAMDHLFRHAFNKKLDAFNAVLEVQKNEKIKRIEVIADFVEIRESNFIKICHKARIISVNNKEMLLRNLGERNTCAHPSDIEIPESKAIAILEDLVKNVILKFKI